MRGLVMGALILGVAALVRPQALFCAPFLVLAYARHAPGWRRAGTAVVVVCAAALVPVLPWTVRNCRVMDGCALVSTNAGWNLAIGAFPRATGRFETLRSEDGCREVTGQVQQDRCWLAYGASHIKASPGRWLGLIPAKLGFTFDHESFAVEYLHEARPSAWPEPRRTMARDVTTFFHRALVVAAALGAIAFSLRRRVQGALFAAFAVLLYVAVSGGIATMWPLVLFTAIVPWLPLPGRPALPPALALPLVLLGTTIVTHAVFFGEDRYHLVVTPVLCMMAAGALRRSA
jgi:hypothetical protein